MRGYGPPAGFNWEWFDGADDPLQDDPTISLHNVELVVDRFVAAALEQAEHYAHCESGDCDIMFTMGSDFHYGNARSWFKSLDRLLHYAKADGRVNAFYSSPQAYFGAKTGGRTPARPATGPLPPGQPSARAGPGTSAAAGTQMDQPRAEKRPSHAWTVKEDDWFPYSDGEAAYDVHTDSIADKGGHAYWTGYYSSRPAFKRQVREASALLQACRQMELFGAALPAAPSQPAAPPLGAGAAAGAAASAEGGGGAPTGGERACDGARPWAAASPSSVRLWLALSVAQHHDAVSGTARQHVSNDYAQRLSAGAAECDALISEVLQARAEAARAESAAAAAAAAAPTVGGGAGAAQAAVGPPPRAGAAGAADAAVRGNGGAHAAEAGAATAAAAVAGSGARVQPPELVAWSPCALNETRCAQTFALPDFARTVRVALYNPLAQPSPPQLLRLPVPANSAVAATDARGRPCAVQLATWDETTSLAIVRVGAVPAVGGTWLALHLAPQALRALLPAGEDGASGGRAAGSAGTAAGGAEAAQAAAGVSQVGKAAGLGGPQGEARAAPCAPGPLRDGEQPLTLAADTLTLHLARDSATGRVRTLRLCARSAAAASADVGADAGTKAAGWVETPLALSLGYYRAHSGDTSQSCGSEPRCRPGQVRRRAALHTAFKRRATPHWGAPRPPLVSALPWALALAVAAAHAVGFPACAASHAVPLPRSPPPPMFPTSTRWNPPRLAVHA